jgi:endoglucanase
MGVISSSNGGPTTAQFARFWAALASKYANNPKIAFELMNEPHDLGDVTLQGWADIVQAAVTAIRQAGATSNMILITGLDWSSAGAFESAFDDFVGPVNDVKNPDGSNANLIYSVHQYLDQAGGLNAYCTDNTAQSIFTGVANMLDQIGGRKAMLTEFGGGNNDQCVKLVCAALDTVK